jgi:hypothetical protein
MKQGRKGKLAEQSVKRLRKPEGAAQPGMDPRCRSLLLASNVEEPPNPREGRVRMSPPRWGPLGRAVHVVSEREAKGMRG